MAWWAVWKTFHRNVSTFVASRQSPRWEKHSARLPASRRELVAAAVPTYRQSWCASTYSFGDSSRRVRIRTSSAPALRKRSSTLGLTAKPIPFSRARAATRGRAT